MVVCCNAIHSVTWLRDFQFEHKRVASFSFLSGLNMLFYNEII